MPDLIAQGIRRENRWRRPLPDHSEWITVGRDAGAWSTHWDDHISREHIRIRWEASESLFVEVVPKASNAVFYQGVPVKTFRVQPGEHFVIGNTTFTITEEAASLEARHIPVTEQTFSPEYLRHLPFRNPGDRLEILNRLPERISQASDDADLHENMLRAIFEGIPSANAAAVCVVDKDDPNRIEFLHWDRTDSEQLQASRRLISHAVESDQTVVHTWQVSDSERQFTESENVDWAFCIPFEVASANGWALYVSGNLDHSVQRIDGIPDLREEMKFAEIAVTTVGSFHEVRQLQRKQASLGQFFSAPVVRALRGGDAEEILAPREVDVTVLFCDLRGFSRATEQFSDDLLGLLRRVSDALGVLTKHILSEGGVIGDFHGDAAMGFWGWPIEQEDAAQRAARAAIAIFDEYSQFAAQKEHTLSEFKIGVGIASGRAVAGKIGTVDQVKVTAFGPAVNLAARLESMTKQLNSEVLIDSETANRIRKDAPADIRLRRLAVVQPYGMDAAIEIHQLLPPQDRYPLLEDEHILWYENALDAFVAGDWTTAWEELHRVPAADTSKDFLTTFIASRNRTPPEGWDGVIRLESK